ncbi:glutathione synthetase [Aspergillus luchuensis]|uniref:Glutathione synthetase n=1 Tax=Aspergillus kawachii TaxID=1069201 RepID=A0A146FL05_ASPKA|nr:glutathione synthetase [Aspergillus luchuensis]
MALTGTHWYSPGTPGSTCARLRQRHFAQQVLPFRLMHARLTQYVHIPPK